MLQTQHINTIEEATALPVMSILSDTALKLGLKATALRKKQLSEALAKEYQTIYPKIESLAISLLGGDLNELWQKQVPVLKTHNGYSLEYASGVKVIVTPSDARFSEVSIHILETRIVTFSIKSGE
ncbi:MAG: hypothetical protein ACRCZZ_06890 [Phocaeicola sp.]